MTKNMTIDHDHDYNQSTIVQMQNNTKKWEMTKGQKGQSINVNHYFAIKI